MHGCGLVLSLVALAGAPALQEGTAGASPPAPGEVDRPKQAEFRSADELLSALEAADEGLVSLTAGVRYDRTAVVQNDHQVYFGRLYFLTGKTAGSEGGGGTDRPAQRKFAIHFDTRITDDVERREESTYIFDGEWLVEKNASERLFIKRQVVPPGERFDPLRIGDGPMPLPIGQKKEDILARYTAELLPSSAGLEPPEDPLPEEIAEAEAVARWAKGSYQVKLTPRPDVPDEEFREIRLWYARGEEGNLLPRMARTVSRTGDISLVRLFDVHVQNERGPENELARVPAEVLDTTSPEGWHVQVLPWRGTVQPPREPREGSR